MMRTGLLSHLAMNGAGPIHDWELALIGATTESVARYIRTGEFGLWHETGRINDAIAAAAGLGLGEAVGRAILDGPFPHKDISVLAQAVRLGVPVTVHVGIGYDIIHQHPNCDGAALGRASYQDFLIFAQAVRGLEDGPSASHQVGHERGEARVELAEQRHRLRAQDPRLGVARARAEQERQ